MTHPTTPPLDGFETALLAHLTAVATDSARAGHPTNPVPSRRYAGRRWYVPGAAVAASLAAVILVHGLWPTPAFAVTGRNNAVEVRVARLEGAEGLEHALEEHGIQADITYLPVGQACAPGRYTTVRTPDLIVAVNATGFLVDIPKDAINNGDTLVVSAFVAPLPHGFQTNVDAGVAHGTVAPCRVVPAR